MISPTFQRISYAPVQDKTFSSSMISPSLISPSIFQLENDLIPSFCYSQPYEDICLITSNTTLTPISYPNITLLTTLPKLPQTYTTLTSLSTRFTSRYTTFSSTSTLIYYEMNSTLINLLNSTPMYDNPPLIISIRTPISQRFRKIFHWQYIWVILIPVLCGIFLCLLIAIFAFIKYRRKDVGVYEVEEAQRFRPLIVELTPSPGERHQDNQNSTILRTNSSTMLSTTDPIKSQKQKRKRKKLPLNSNDEQREFYI